MNPELFLFHTGPQILAAIAHAEVASDARVAGVVVDWERAGKLERQSPAESIIGTDTQISTDSRADLERVRRSVSLPIVCRIDAWRIDGRNQLEAAIDAGAGEVLLPMVRSVSEVEEAIDLAAGRIGVGVMLETSEAISEASAIAGLGIDRAYVGLMDLGIDRGHGLFVPLVDGTVERARDACGDVPFGFGGLTGPGFGAPIPSHLLAAEMARLSCDFTFLRRSFLRDHGDDPAGGIRSIRSMLADLTHRSAADVEADRRQLHLEVSRCAA